MNKQKCDRRTLLKYFSRVAAVASLSPLEVYAFKLSDFFGRGSKAYFSTVIQRYHKWWCQEYFDFDKALKPIEIEYINYCQNHIHQWEFEPQSNWAAPLFLYGAKFGQDSETFSRIKYGASKKSNGFYNVLFNVMKYRGITTEKSRLRSAYGLGWNIEKDEIKVYYHYRTQQGQPTELSDKMWGQVIKHGKSEKYFLVDVFKDNKLRDVELIVHDSNYRNPRNPDIYNYLVESSDLVIRGDKTNSHENMRNFNLDFLNSKGKEFASRQLEEFAFVTDSMCYEGQNDFKLYYP